MWKGLQLIKRIYSCTNLLVILQKLNKNVLLLFRNSVCTNTRPPTCKHWLKGTNHSPDFIYAKLGLDFFRGAAKHFRPSMYTYIHAMADWKGTNEAECVKSQRTRFVVSDKTGPAKESKRIANRNPSGLLLARFRALLWESCTMNLPWELPVATHPVICSGESSNFARAFSLSRLDVVVVRNHVSYVYEPLVHTPLWEPFVAGTSGTASFSLPVPGNDVDTVHAGGVQLNDIL